MDHVTDGHNLDQQNPISQSNRGGYPRFWWAGTRSSTPDSGYVNQDRTFRLATQILQAYRMVRKINTDRFYKMHGTPGGTVRDTELKIVPVGSSYMYM